MPSVHSTRGVALRVAAAAGLLLAVSSAPPASSQVSPNGPEFQVNTYTTNDQDRPAVASDAQGNFVVTWMSYGSSGTDSSGTSIQAQRFAANGTPRGAEFQVNTYTTLFQGYPAVAADAQGNFVIVWQSYLGIQAQRYDANGIPLGGEFQVNTFTFPWRFPAVAMDGQGDFVVAWESYGMPDFSNVQAQRFDANGTPLGGEFVVNTYTTSYQNLPAVAMDWQGNFVVAWQSYGSSGTDTSRTSIQAQLFDANGVPQGSEFQVNSFTESYQFDPAVAADLQGGFVVAWVSRGSSGTDTSHESIQGQRFDASGAPQGTEFQVNTVTTGYQWRPALATDAVGNFVVAWMSSLTGTNSWDVEAQRFLADGTQLGDEFQVNTYTTSNQTDPTVAADGRGNLLLAWQSRGSSGTDTSQHSIQGQRYDGLFRDGFEAGDTSRWSLAIP